MRRTCWADTFTLILLALLPLLFWWQLWTPDPANRRTIPDGDFSSQYYPLQQYAARELIAGRLPIWNPYLNAGQPALADPQSGVFYPLNLLPNLVLALLDLDYGFGLLQAQVILHSALASIFTFLFVRHLSRKTGARPLAARAAGATAALAFAYSGYLTSFPVQQITILETSVWLPLVLLYLDQALNQDNVRAGLLAGGALACAILAGHPQSILYLIYAVIIYGLLAIWPVGITLRRPGAVPGLRRVGTLLGVLATGGLLSTVQILPSASFLLRSTRSGLDYADVAHGFSLPELINMLYPGYFGGTPQYLGVGVTVLAAAGLALARPRRQSALWAGMAVVALLLAMGGNTFLYAAAYQVAPGFSFIRNQERIIYLFSFSASVLAGLGMAALATPLSPQFRVRYQTLGKWLRGAFLAMLGLTALWYYGSLTHRDAPSDPFAGILRHHVLVLIILAGLVGVLAFRRRRHWMAVAAMSLVALELFTVNSQYNLAVPPESGSLYPHSAVVDFLRHQQEASPEPFRISSAGLLPGGASAASVYEIEDITANTPVRFEAFQKAEQTLGSWQLWQLLNVWYVLDRRDLDGPGLVRVLQEGEVRVYRMTDPMPRAWIALRVSAVASDDEAIAAMQSPDFDPRAEAFVQAAALDHPFETASGTSRILDRIPGRLTIEADSPTGGLLVISQVWDPGWRAEVDGQRVPLLRTDLLLQGVYLPAGSHRVVLAYRPVTLGWGAFLSSGTVLLWLLVVVAVNRRPLLAKDRG